ncbi:MAG: NADH-quinone oxidoreductase subunit NuoK [Myxococcota bacterium]
MTPWLLLAGAMFNIGLWGVLTRKNLVGLLVAVEIMANAANLNLLVFARFSGQPWGQALALFAIALTVAEVGVGLALIMLVARSRHGVDTDDVAELRG